MTTYRKTTRNTWRVLVQRERHEGARVYWYPTDAAALLAYRGFCLDNPYFVERSDPNGWLIASNYRQPRNP